MMDTIEISSLERKPTNLCHLPLEVLTQIQTELAKFRYRATVSITQFAPDNTSVLSIAAVKSCSDINASFLIYVEPVTHSKYRILFHHPDFVWEQFFANSSTGDTFDPGWILGYANALECEIMNRELRAGGGLAD